MKWGKKTSAQETQLSCVSPGFISSKTQLSLVYKLHVLKTKSVFYFIHRNSYLAGFRLGVKGASTKG